MNILKQTLIIPKNHHLHFDVTLPDNFPVGKTDVILTFIQQPTSESNSKGEKLLKLAGSLKSSRNFSGDPLSLQRALRDEWKR